MPFLLLSAALSTCFSFSLNLISLVHRNSSSFIPFLVSFFSAPTTESYQPPSTAEELPEAILLYDPPAERTWSGMATVNSIPFPTSIFVSEPEPALAFPVISLAAIGEEIPPQSMDWKFFKSIVCAVIAIAFITYLLWLLCCPGRKRREVEGLKIQTESIGTQTDIDDNPQNKPQNGSHTNATCVCNACTDTNDISKTTIKIICNGDHGDLHRRLARFESKKQEEDHTQRCLARNGNDINAEDLSNEALMRIVRDERMKHAKELELLTAENTSLRHRPEIPATPPPNPIQENSKSQEKLKDEIEQSFKKEIKQIEDQHATELDGLREEIKELGKNLSICRGANSARGANVSQCQEAFTALQQEVTKIIVALLWINQEAGYQLIPRLKALLPNLPLEQFTTARCNGDAQFPQFRWVLYNCLPNYTFTCPCGGSPGISPDHLREQLSSIHPEPSNIMPDYGLSIDTSSNNNLPQPIFGSTGYVVAPTNQPEAYLGDRISRVIPPPQLYQPAPPVPQTTLTPPPQQFLGPTPPQVPTPPSATFPLLNPLPQPIAPPRAPPIAITGLDKLDELEPPRFHWTPPELPDPPPPVWSASVPNPPPVVGKSLGDAAPLSTGENDVIFRNAPVVLPPPVSTVGSIFWRQQDVLPEGTPSVPAFGGSLNFGGLGM
ncbi:hypothetical protein EG327_000408 [Venturia inaequalis]|uniref:Uncharacterized protein n=1 Tax=Venturia inaequalis TaxID=5025 RepID=A0A8H3VMH5_VENIN|nr:hypothetical protein EG327_000408 [Venturia inaequalis]